MAMTDALRASARELYPSAELTLESGETVRLTAADIVSLEIQEGADSALTPGSVISASCALTLENADGRWLPLSGERSPLENAAAALFLNVQEGAAQHCAPMGVFTITAVSAREQRPVILLSGCDGIGTDLSAPFADALTYPAPLSALWAHAVDQSGYVWQGAVPNGSAVIDARPDWGEISVRQAMGYIAAAAGCFVQLDREGALQLRPCRRSAVEASLSPEAYMTLTRGFDSFGPVAGLRVMPVPDANGVQEALEVFDGDIDGAETLLVENNPLFMQGAAHLTALARGMLAQLAGLSLAKAEFRWRGDPGVGVGTRLALTDTRGETHLVTVTRQTMRCEGGFSAECACETPDRSDSGVLRAITPEGGVNGGALVGVVDGGLLRTGSVRARSIAAQSITAEKLAAGAVYAQALEAVNANIQNLTAGRINTDELYASMAQMASAIVTDASIASADIGDLAAQVAEIAQAQIDGADIEEANIGDANVQTLAAVLAQIINLTAQSATIEAANIDWAHIANLTAQAETVAQSNIGSAAISYANIDWAEIKTLATALANINTARMQQATIDQADIDTLNAGIADVLTITAQHGDFAFATVQRLLASSFILEQGIGDTLFIKNLTATSAMFVQATLGELCLKGDDGKYYDVSVAADGTIHTQDTGYTDADIIAGVAPDGKKVVVTEAAIDELNSTNIRAESLIVSEIFAAALTADVISAGQAFIASATIPELYVTAITAIGETLTISAGQINMTAGGTLEDYEEDIAADIDGLSSDLTEVREVAEGAAGAIRSMAVGGVNLVDDSALIAIAGTDDPETSYRELASGLLPGMAYTLSMESATLTAGSAAGMTLEAVRLPDADQGETEETILLTDTLDFSGGHQKYTFVTADDGHTYALRIYAGIKGAGNGRAVELEKVKLERGTFATMWTESLSDAEARLVELSSQLSVTAGGLSGIVTHVTEDVDGTIRNVNDYFKFDGSDPNNPKLILGTDTSPMTMELTNSRLSFLWHGDAVAYFSNNKLYVTNVEAIERMSIGTDSNGFLDIVTTATGVGFIWRS